MSYVRELTGGAAAASRQTIKAPIGCVGHGLHTGERVNLRLLPAAPHTGIVFRRVDLGGIEIPAAWNHVVDTRLCTVLGLHGEPAARVGTVEHLMAAITAAGIHDLTVEVDAPELPILDGSAEGFLFLIQSAGIAAHGGLRESLRVLRPVRVEQGAAWAEILPNPPGDDGFSLSLAIDFAAAAIGAQSYAIRLNLDGFVTELAAARTFTQAGEIEAMRDAGLAKGGSLANAVVVDGPRVLNPEGLRWANEPVRHKMLDMVGDLALAPAPLAGRVVANRAGHALNNRLLHALLADGANYRLAPAFVEAASLSAA